MGRIRNLAALPYAYLQTLYSGLVSARWIESSPLVVSQALTLRESGRGQEILLSVRSDVRGWELPGGRVESGERASEALAREMREETGLDVEVGRHVGDYVRTGFRPHVARVYVCQVRSGKERPSSETLEVRWFPVDDLPRELLPWYHQPIADGLSKSLDSTQRFEHQGMDAIWSALKIDLRMRWYER